MTVIINGDTGISPVTASGTSASVDGMTVGRGGGEVATNTAVGASALNANTTGSLSVAIGTSALAANTTSDANTAVGYQAASTQTTGALYTTAFGYQSLKANTSGTQNNALGFQSLTANTTGANNSGFGTYALAGNTTGGSNTAFGNEALRSNTTASNNTAVGYQAATANTTGAGLVAVGRFALSANTTGASNTALGHVALYETTTGNYNTAVGQEALRLNTTASNNTAVGYQAGYSQTTNGNGTYFGYQAGYACTGATNTFIGPYCGYLVTTGAKNTIIGNYSGNNDGLDIRTASNAIILSDGDGYPKGYFATNTYGEFTLNSSLNATYNGILNFGNQTTIKSQIYYSRGVTSLYVVNSSAGVYLGSGSTAWASASDERLKDIIEPIENGLTKVSSLRAVIGKFKTDAEGTRRSFLIAQDVQAVLPEAISTTMVKDDETNTEYLGVSYTDVIPLLVSAIKELKAEFDAYKATHP
jgi:trimeric autotransporter adhesin